MKRYMEQKDAQTSRFVESLSLWVVRFSLLCLDLFVVAHLWIKPTMRSSVFAIPRNRLYILIGRRRMRIRSVHAMISCHNVWSPTCALDSTLYPVRHVRVRISLSCDLSLCCVRWPNDLTWAHAHTVSKCVTFDTTPNLDVPFSVMCIIFANKLRKVFVFGENWLLTSLWHSLYTNCLLA